MVSAVCGGVRVVSLYAPNGRSLDSPFYQAKLVWYERLARWLAESRDPGEAMALGGDYNIAPADADVWDPDACHGGTPRSEAQRRPVGQPLPLGPIHIHRPRPAQPGPSTRWEQS